MLAQGRRAVLYDDYGQDGYRLCDKSTGHLHETFSYGDPGAIEHGGSPTRPTNVVFQGHYVGGHDDLGVEVFDIHTGNKTLHYVDVPVVSILVLNARGSVAWAAPAQPARPAQPDGTPASPYVPAEIVVYDSRGRRVIDSEPGIDVRSLRLSHGGTQLSWKVPGGIRVAPLR